MDTSKLVGHIGLAGDGKDKQKEVCLLLSKVLMEEIDTYFHSCGMMPLRRKSLE